MGHPMQRISKLKTLAQRGFLASVLGTALLLTACGGGGGGGAAQEAGSNPDPSMPITTPTMPDVTPTVPGTPTTPGTTPTAPVGLQNAAIVSRDNEGGNGFQQVAIDAAGNSLTVWLKEDFSDNYELLVRRYVAGSGWQAVEVLASTNTRRIEFPRLTMDPATGKAMVVWAERRRTANAAGLLTTDIVARTFAPAPGWAAGVVVENDQPVLSANTSVATDASGNVMAVWNRYETLQNRIYASRYTAGGGWTAPARIEDNPEIPGGGSGPLVAFLPSGDALVVWNSSRGGTTTNIWGNKYTVGAGWGTNALVMSGSGAQTTGLIRLLGRVFSLVSDQNGNALITFENQQLFSNPSRYELNVWSKRYSSGSWGADSTAAPVGVPYTCTNCPSVTGVSHKMNAQGQSVVTWFVRSNAVPDSSGLLWAARSKSDGTWESQVISNGLPEFFAGDNPADVGIDAQGNIKVVWSSGDNSPMRRLYSTAYAPGAGWAPNQTLTDSPRAERQRIAMNARGDAMTVWQDFSNSVGTQLFGRYFSSGR